MVDVVMTWVNGNDPVLRAERQQYLTGKREDTLADIAGPQRFLQADEIRFSVASILRFAPFVGRIFIVTNRQDPQLGDFIRKYFPESRVEIKIIDQNTLFRGSLERHTPVFNSISVETVICRIPGLSDRFIYMNDDFFFTAPIEEKDLFTPDGKVICYADRYSVPFVRIQRFLKPKKKGHKPFGYKDSLANGARALGSNHFWLMPHEPHPLRKDILCNWFDAHPDVEEANLAHRFRDESQFNVQGFFYVLAEQLGKAEFRSPKGRTVFFKPGKGRKNYMERKLREAEGKAALMFGCMNSLPEASDKERALFLDWIGKRLGIDFTDTAQ